MRIVRNRLIEFSYNYKAAGYQKIHKRPKKNENVSENVQNMVYVYPLVLI